MKANLRTNMRLKVRKVIKDIKAGRFGQSVQSALSRFPDPDPGDRRRARACMCVR